MTVVIRYFSTAGAGAADGTTWADRAQLVSGATWSTVITGFNFSGSDSLVCLIGPGTHSPTAQLQSSSFTNAPTIANLLQFHGCDSSGNRLFPANLDWRSDQVAWDDSGLPLIATTTNISLMNLANFTTRMIKWSASGITGSNVAIFLQGLSIDWCSILLSSNNSNAIGVTATTTRVSNALFSTTGASFRAAMTLTTGLIRNCRFINTGGGTGGNRHGIEFTGTAATSAVELCCIVGYQGDAIGTSSSGAGGAIAFIRKCTLVNCNNGIKLNATASQTAMHVVEGCLITGCTTAGIDGNTNGHLLLSRTRLRNNGTNLVNLGNTPIDWDIDTSAGSDAAEYVNTSISDYRVLYGSAIWGNGYGVTQQGAPAGGCASVLRSGIIQGCAV